MKKIRVICPFEVKNKELLSLEHHYLKQLSLFKVELIETKSFGENIQKETSWLKEKLKNIHQDNIFLMREKGKELDSLQFANLIEKKLTCEINLVFSGALGFSEELLETYQGKLSLSQLTFPHKLSRLVLIEQLYRAQSIITSHPYHN